ncbi:migration and invasion enhancer 1 [Chelonus insularis]|uniref:migration and invasion enhancer 1 n=1 Tax=Chelonus insularis TaxID=460826 RepID=UPI00158F21E7|nr:migration and invasion enhancer 1 [Chelonus insularis]
MAGVKINVEYCGGCGHRKQFLELAELLKQGVPEVQISGAPGRQGSFEVTINDELVYSKRQTMAFPRFSEVIDVVKEVSEGQKPRQITKQQPINCVLS